MEKNYQSFAKYYDILMLDANYPKRANFMDNIIKKYKKNSGNVLLDIACGTGNMAEQMCKTGYDVIASDLSEEMLEVAVEKKIEQNLSIQYVCQDMRNIELFSTVDIVICTFDSLNHLDSIEDIEKTFNSVYKYLEKDGIFLFDMNTIYKHKNILSNNTFVFDTDEVYCVWDNCFDEADNSVCITLDFFEKDGDCYYRSGEQFFERAYKSEIIENLLKKTGFNLLEMYDGDDFDKVIDTTQRILYVASK